MTTTQLTASGHAYVLAPGQGRVIEEFRIRLLADSAQTGGSLYAAEVQNPGPGGPPLHTHLDSDEFYLVLEGQYRFRIGEREFDGGVGTFAHVPRGVSHTFASLGPTMGKLFTAGVPGGSDQYLEKLAALQARGATEAEMVALHRQYRTEIDGPPILSAEAVSPSPEGLGRWGEIPTD